MTSLVVRKQQKHNLTTRLKNKISFGVPVLIIWINNGDISIARLELSVIDQLIE